jgi:hypothetical protein
MSSDLLYQSVNVFRALRSIDPQELDKYIADLEDALATAKLLRQAQEIIAARVKADSYLPATDLSRQELVEAVAATAATIPQFTTVVSEAPPDLALSKAHVQQLLFQLLTDHGPATIVQLSERSNLEVGQVAAALREGQILFQPHRRRECWHLTDVKVRRVRLRQQAYGVLRAYGPQTTMALARAFGLSSHMVGQLLRGDPQLQRDATTTQWSLVAVETKTDSAA